VADVTLNALRQAPEVLAGSFVGLEVDRQATPLVLFKPLQRGFSQLGDVPMRFLAVPVACLFTWLAMDWTANSCRISFSILPIF
jgi:hypothetical protein